MEINALAEVIDSAEKNDVIALELVLVKKISEECLCLAAMVLWVKLQRTSCFSHFRDSLCLKFFSIYQPCWYGAYLETCTSPTSNNCGAKTRNGTVYYWSDYLNKVCSMIYSRCNNAPTIILTNDKFMVLKSNKYGEHNSAQQHTPISLKISHSFLIQTNHGEIEKVSSITEAFKALIQSKCSTSTSWINLLWIKGMLPRISLAQEMRMTRKLKLTRWF